MGTPKALLRDEAGASFLTRAVEALRDGGCPHVVVVLGAGAAEASSRLDGLEPPVEVVVAEDWDEGMGASLRCGLRRVADTDAAAALVTLVDLPDVGPRVVGRMLEGLGPAEDAAENVLVRASYDGVPGHPVLLGRAHWHPVAVSARGDRGARDYLLEHPPVLVECGDLATGRDVDSPDDL